MLDSYQIKWHSGKYGRKVEISKYAVFGSDASKLLRNVDIHCGMSEQWAFYLVLHQAQQPTFS